MKEILSPKDMLFYPAKVPMKVFSISIKILSTYCEPFSMAAVSAHLWWYLKILNRAVGTEGVRG